MVFSFRHWLQLLGITWCLNAPNTCASSNHDDLQFREKVHTSWQQYEPPGAARAQHDDGRRLLLPIDHCERVALQPWEPLRIGYEFLDSDDVSQEVRDHIENHILARAIDFWSRALRVHRVLEPLRAEYTGENCIKYGMEFNGHIITKEEHFSCEKATAPVCGPHGLAIPAKYLKRKRVCTKVCPRVLETLAHLFKVSDMCDNCTELPEGPGAEGYDFFAFVTIKDDFCEGDVQAHATTCVHDQCDRPIFGLVNFCRTKISLKAADTDRQVTTAVHELAHALAFSAHHFHYFRNTDGSPKLPREAENPMLLQGASRWSCHANEVGTTYSFPDRDGDRRYVDLSTANIIGKFSERGLDKCPCPVGQKEMHDGCILSPQAGFREPKCVMRVTTPMVVQKAREFFGCDSLPGAELENQPSSPCVIVASHWEQRAFMGEVMVSTQVIEPTFLSEVTLALFQDSGWYMPDYNMADKLAKGVHWAYKQGCNFATKRCIENGSTEHPRFWCTKPEDRACSLDRGGEVQCSFGSLPPGMVVPRSLHYSHKPLLGSVSEADYCPLYHVRITNHDCRDTSAMTFPVSNVNFERERFGASSRCLESTLNADVEVADGVYRADAEKFTTVKPRCYEVRCAAQRYEVWVSDLNGGIVKLGTCAEGVYKLTGLGLNGAVICAPFEELCGIVRATHLGSPPSENVAPRPTSRKPPRKPAAVISDAQLVHIGPAAGALVVYDLATVLRVLVPIVGIAGVVFWRRLWCQQKPRGWISLQRDLALHGMESAADDLLD